MRKRDGGSAFPRSGAYANMGTPRAHSQEGMSLRDWFAGMALQGLTVGTDLEQAAHRGLWPDHDKATKFCYAIADAMLKAREQSHD